MSEILKKFYKVVYFGYGNNQYNDIEFFQINEKKKTNSSYTYKKWMGCSKYQF